MALQTDRLTGACYKPCGFLACADISRSRLSIPSTMVTAELHRLLARS